MSHNWSAIARFADGYARWCRARQSPFIAPVDRDLDPDGRRIRMELSAIRTRFPDGP